MTNREQPVLTVVIPCYNSSDYLDHCVESLLTGSLDVEIVIVDDGSVDDTPAIADGWAARHPEAVRVIHQPNKGHGGAVMAGLAAARGAYFFVVDSDDWVDDAAFGLLLSTLRRMEHTGPAADLVVVNYVHEHTDTGTRRVRAYRALPKNRPFTWDETRHFTPSQNMMMHSLVYRTEVLRTSRLELPEHTFYVDNLFAYVPLPYVKTLYYLPVDLYRYFIGRADQSVNMGNLLKRQDQFHRVVTLMLDAVKLPEGARNPKLAAYMAQYLGVTIAFSTVIALIDGSPEAFAERARLWKRIDPSLRPHLGLPARLTNVPGRWSRPIVLAVYELARRLYRFL